MINGVPGKCLPKGRLAPLLFVAALFLLFSNECGAEVIQDKNPVKAFTPEQAAHFVQLALDCAVQEYPNKIGHTMQSDADQGTPGSLHPAFYGCFDWHSSVHGHWLLARFSRLYPDHRLAAEARDILAGHLTDELIGAEVDYLLSEGRASWERPYGLAWLLQLAMELHEWSQEGHADAGRWAAALAPLEMACVDRLENWLPKLAYPIRTGEHSQTAFAFGLMLDYARAANDSSFALLVETTTHRLYGADLAGDLRFEPSGQDFLSPILAEADLMRRVMDPPAFAVWLRAFMTDIPDGSSAGWLPVARVTDRSDGKLAHLDGLNLSRAWMLEGIVSGLPLDDPRREILQAAARAHREAGLAAVTGEHYEGGHWLGTYAMYLNSRRGLASSN
jgi:Protein of unknown function (DUF2891)